MLFEDKGRVVNVNYTYNVITYAIIYIFINGHGGKNTYIWKLSFVNYYID